MNRRAFILSGGASALVATGGLGTSRRAFAQASPTYDPSILDAATSAHASVISKSYNGVGVPQDFLRLATQHRLVSQNLVSTNFDAAFKSQIATVTASSLNPATNDYTGAIQRIQTYSPNFSASDFQQLIQYVDNSPANVAQALASLKQNGLTPTLNDGANYYTSLWKALTNAGVGGGGMASSDDPTAAKLMQSPWRHGNAKRVHLSDLSPTARPAIYTPGKDSPHLRNATWAQQLMMSLPPSDGGGGTACQNDAAAGLAYGTAIAVVATMCFFSVIGDALCVPVFLYWAGTAGAGWGLGHAVACGF